MNFATLRTLERTIYGLLWDVAARRGEGLRGNYDELLAGPRRTAISRLKKATSLYIREFANESDEQDSCGTCGGAYSVRVDQIFHLESCAELPWN